MNRPTIEFEAFYELYYKHTQLSEKTVHKLLKLISSTLHVPIGKLRPTDRFDKELSDAFSFFDGDFLQLTFETKHLFSDLKVKMESLDFENKKVLTLDDYLKIIGMKCQEIEGIRVGDMGHPESAGVSR